MKLFKEILLYVVLACLFCIFNVSALSNGDVFSDLTIPDGNGVSRFFSNNNGTLEDKGYSLLTYGDIKYALPSIPNYFYGNYGGTLNICNLSFVQNNYYSISYTFVTNSNNDYLWPHYSSSNYKLGLSNVVSPTNLTFNLDTQTDGVQIANIPGLIPIGDYVYTFTIIFKATLDRTCLNLAFSSQSKNMTATEAAFVGYKYESLGNKPLTQEEMTTIINNSNQNVINNINSSISSTRQAIIDNQDANNQALIDANEQNTESIIDSQKACTDLDININSLNSSNYSFGYLNDNGTIFNSQGSVISDYVKINPSSSYVLRVNYTAISPSYCFYDENKTLISCEKYNQRNTINITSPANSQYIRFSAYIGSDSYNTIFNGKICQPGNQAVQDSINDLNNTINNDDVSDADPLINDFLNDSAFQDNTGLSSVINAPLSLLSHLTETCQPINFTIPWFDAQVSIPCMSTSVYNKFDSSFITIIKAIVNGVLVYRIVIGLYFMVKDFKDPESDRVEVIDL